MDRSPQAHWNQVYSASPPESLGWYEADPNPSLALIQSLHLPLDAPLLDAGAGATTLIDHLLELGYSNLTAVDVSPVALERLQRRLGGLRAAGVRWVVEDLTRPTALATCEPVALWHDRALLHFLTEEAQRKNYHAAIERLVRQGGYVIIAAFSLEGAAQCSGLSVRRYDAPLLQEFMGPGYDLLDSLGYLYHMPSGDPRPYVYAVFRRSG